jgi:hypothetical protein
MFEPQRRYGNRSEPRNELLVDDRTVSRFGAAADLASPGQPILGELLKSGGRGSREGSLIGDELASKIVFVCSDMWQPYLRVIREKCSQALHILDRFHIVAKMNLALDDVRGEESNRMRREGRVPVLKNRGGCYSHANTT